MAVEEIDKEKKTERNPSMTKSEQERVPEDAKVSPTATAAAAWGTWEELLLAYAVNRYGTKSWDSISSELRKRSSAPIHLTPHHCEQKYVELKRRFNQSDDNDVVMDNGSETTTITATAIPWLDELRKLRVLELQRELRNYDLYISSLQTKVKKLTEESEKTGGDTKNKSDLRHRNEEIELDKTEEAMNNTPEPEVSSDEDSDRENQSVNGSNGNLETGVEKSGNNGNENEASPVGTGDEKPESAAVLPVREDDSCNGEPEGNEPVKTEPDGEASESPESIAESKSEGKNSDVQSSASKSRNERMPRVSSKEDEREIDDQSTDSIPVRSLPLVDFLHKLQKLGSAVFERRLDRQEKIRYKNLIRQHIDHETLQTRLKQGWYSDGNDKFFRDLLLLVNNTRIFFPKQSPESTAAADLRQLILNEMISKKKQRSDSKLTNKHLKRAADRPDSLLIKPKLAGPIVVCRKRSSITAKAAGSSSGKKEQTGSKNPSNPEKLLEENPRKSRDSFPLVTKKKGKSLVNESSDSKPEKKKKVTEAEEKKQSAAKFLNRMKRSNEPLLNTLNGTSKSTSERDDGGDGKKDQAGKKSSSGRQVKGHGSPAKRSVGRPPKRAVAPLTLAAMSGKRNRESVDSELGSQQTKKRSKR